MTLYKQQYQSKFQKREVRAAVRLDAERIIMEVDISKHTLLRVAETIENEKMCSKTAVEEGKIYLLWPDYGICGDEEDFKLFLSEIFSEENVELIF